MGGQSSCTDRYRDKLKPPGPPLPRLVIVLSFEVTYVINFTKVRSLEQLVIPSSIWHFFWCFWDSVVVLRVWTYRPSQKKKKLCSDTFVSVDDNTTDSLSRTWGVCPTRVRKCVEKKKKNSLQQCLLYLDVIQCVCTFYS